MLTWARDFTLRLYIISGTERAFKRVGRVTVMQHLKLAAMLAFSQNPSLLVKGVTDSSHALSIYAFVNWTDVRDYLRSDDCFIPSNSPSAMDSSGPYADCFSSSAPTSKPLFFSLFNSFPKI